MVCPFYCQLAEELAKDTATFFPPLFDEEPQPAEITAKHATSIRQSSGKSFFLLYEIICARPLRF